MASPTPFTRPPLPALPSGQDSMIITDKPIPVPHYLSGMSFTVHARATINAPASLVASEILSVRKWGSWNSFVPACDIAKRGEPVVPYPVGLAPKAGEEEKWCRVGDGLSMHVNMPGKALADIDEAEREALLKSPEFVTGIEVLDPAKEEGRTGFRIHWKAMQAPDFLLRAQRVQEVVDLGEGRSEYVTYASFGGYGASVVKWTNGSKLIDRFGDMARDLKGWSEKLYAEQKVASA